MSLSRVVWNQRLPGMAGGDPPFYYNDIVKNSQISRIWEQKGLLKVNIKKENGWPQHGRYSLVEQRARAVT